MPWARLDDKFHSHASTLIAGLEANGLFARSLSYCADHLTDGLMTDAWLKSQGVSPARARALVQRLEAVGVVQQIEDGFLVVDYLKYNPSRDKVLAAREARQAAGRKAAEKRWKRR